MPSSNDANDFARGLETRVINPAEQMIAERDEQIEELTKLLKGACLTLIELGGPGYLGPAVRQWWAQQPESVDEQVRTILLELTPSQIGALNDYCERHGVLPTAVKS